MIADAATVATRARSGVTSPLPSGCTRFDRKTTNSFVAGSIQSDVPVKPVCPNEPSGSSSPRFDEKRGVEVPAERAHVAFLAGGAGVVIFATVSGERIRAPRYAPPSSSMRQKIARSAAVLNSPAWPATPPIRRAVGSCTTPRSICGVRAIARPAERRAASRSARCAPQSDAGGRNSCPSCPSGSKILLAARTRRAAGR